MTTSNFRPPRAPASGRLALTVLAALLTALAALAAATCTVEVAPETTAREVEPSQAGPVPAAFRQSSTPVSYTDLRSDEQAIVDLFENTSPSVVYISTIAMRADAFGRVMSGPGASGTGFVWDDEGHIITNAHVIDAARQILAVMHDQTRYIAELVGESPRHDLAVLRIDAPRETLQRIQPGDSDRLRVGQHVYAIGNPFGLSATLTTGIISALNREIEGLTGDIIEDVIQTDAAINQGNSGGPLLDSGGRVIGVNSQILSPSGTSAGLGFAVPINTVQRVAPQLIANGEYTPALLGISRVDTRLSQQVSRRLGVSGVLIIQVTPGSGAHSAGLRGTDLRAGQLGDIITAIDDEPVRTLQEVRLVLDRHQPGDKVEIQVFRDGETRTVTVTLH